MRQLPKWIWGVGLLLLLAIGAWFFWPSGGSEPTGEEVRRVMAVAPQKLVLDFFARQDFLHLQLISLSREPAVVSAVAGTDGTPPSPTQVEIRDTQRGDSLRLSWTLPDDSSRTAVQVWRGDSAATLARSVTLPASATEFIDSGLTAGTTYWYKIVSVAGEVTSVGEALSGRPTDTTPPPPPAAMSLERLLKGTGFSLSWTAPVVGEGLTYKVLRSDKANVAGQVLVSSLGVTTYDDGTAVAGTTYWYRVVAVDQAGNESVAVLAHPVIGRSPLLGVPTATLPPVES